ncbi:MAG: hypothetical protein IJ418_16330 [Clostridia bacterium]|nr:hypothetical protein [Clostridia bacterium]
MLSYIEALKEQIGLPAVVVTALIILFFAIQVVGELLEFKGKVVPEFVKIRKYFARKRQERENIKEMSETMKSVKVLLDDVGKHYSEDNIKMRDGWIKEVNRELAESKEHWRELNATMLTMLIESKRNTIINFASRVIDPSCIVTREEFNRVFKIYEEYEQMIEANGLTNGEVDIAIRIIREAYEERLRNHSFVEDIRGYNRD